MSTAAAAPPPRRSPSALDTTVVTSWKAPIAFGDLHRSSRSLLAVFAPRTGDTTFRLSDARPTSIQLPDDRRADDAGAVDRRRAPRARRRRTPRWLVSSKRRVPLWLIVVFAVLFMFGFLTWAAAGRGDPRDRPALRLAEPRGPAHLRRARAACSASASASSTSPSRASCSPVRSPRRSSRRSPVSRWLGLIAAMVAGVLVALVLAAFAIKYFVDQVIVGVVLNVLVIGLTSFLYSQVLAPNAAAAQHAAALRAPADPAAQRDPDHRAGAVPADHHRLPHVRRRRRRLRSALFHTKWGLRLRAVGEHPQAADTVGINVNRTRFWNVALAGAIAGLGGAFFTLGSGIAFNKEMTAGAGFIALAAVIFGRWDPIRATLAALLFGFAIEPAERAVGSSARRCRASSCSCCRTS